ncbi:MAG TPA: class I SAM-dependent methyltransferase, partial [Burkholderiales bacterium]|nr:class I SAM-dependent methyltransferase [Burkholderiales bacterium]
AESLVKSFLACLLVCWSALAPATVHAQAQTLDVPYVPTPAGVVDAMLKMANVGASDYVVDLGCGDGRLVITAAKQYGAHGFGVDLDPRLVNEAQHEAARQGVQDHVAFYERNLYITDFSRASVLTLYLFPKVNLDLRPRLFSEVRPGTRVVSHDFDFGAWEPDEKQVVAVPGKSYGPPQSTLYFWIVPANASGRWTWQLGDGGNARDYDVTLEQTFQMLRAQAAGAVRDGAGRMRGDEVRFTLTVEAGGQTMRQEYRGRLDGDTIVGSVRSEDAAGEHAWKATRMTRGKINIEEFVATPGKS